jgi:D-aspartate ligase
MAVAEVRGPSTVVLGAAGRPEGALVLGGDYRALGVVRSLGRRGVPVWVIRQGDDSLAALSRYARRRFPWPEEGSEAEQVDALMRIARAGARGWALIPSSDEMASLVARNHRELVGSFVLTTPPWEVMRYACDKRLTYWLATTLGVDAPATWYPSGYDDLAALELDFPVILKPAWKEGFNRLTAAKAWRVDDRDALLAAYDEALTMVSPETLMIQELISGGGDQQFSYAALCDAGRPLAHVVARRTRQYPPDFGRASTYVETVECDDVIAPSLRIIEELHFSGLVEFEYKRDPATGRFLLLDVNPRVWGWHTLCGRAGVDFPYLLWQALQGRDFPPVRSRPGVRWVRTSTDLPMVAKEVLGGRMSLRAYGRSLRGPLEGAIFARDDLAPGLLEFPLLASILARRLLHGDAV